MVAGSNPAGGALTSGFTPPHNFQPKNTSSNHRVYEVLKNFEESLQRSLLDVEFARKVRRVHVAKMIDVVKHELDENVVDENFGIQLE